MEQDDLAKFYPYDDMYERTVLSCQICGEAGRDIKAYEIGIQPNLLELMEDAAAHFAAVHRKSNEAV